MIRTEKALQQTVPDVVGVGEGTGLGLSISHGIIKRMRGQMFARNDEKGAVFELVLPPAEQTPA